MEYAVDFWYSLGEEHGALDMVQKTSEQLLVCIICIAFQTHKFLFKA